MLRLVVAFLLAPLAGLCGAAIVTWLLFSFGDFRSLPYASLMVLGGAFFAYPFVLVVGIPSFLTLSHFRVTSLWAFLVIGAIFGVIGWFVASSPASSLRFLGQAIAEGVFGLVAGMLGTAAFWQMAVRRREP